MSKLLAPPAAPPPWWRRLHGSLMPDYNRRSTLFWCAVVVCGAAVFAASAAAVLMQGPPVVLQVLVATLLAMSAGLFPLRVPGTKNSFSASDVPVFLVLLVHGPAAAALVSAFETGLSSYRTSRRWTSRIFTPCASALTMFATGSLLHALLERWSSAARAEALLALIMAVALLQFLASLQMMSGVLRLKRGEPFLVLRDAVTSHRWVGIAYAGSAAVAALLYHQWRESGSAVLLVMVPLLAMVVVSLHFYYRQQEAAEAMREARDRAAEREAEMAAQAAQAAQTHLRALQASERRFHSAFTHASIGMALLSFDGRILQANTALAGLLGRPVDELAGTSMLDAIDELDRQRFGHRLGLGAEHEFEAFADELRCRHTDGSTVWCAVHCAFFSEPDRDSPCLILQAQDITARRAAEAGLHHLAFHDPLTGLPNRRRFLECLTGAVARNQSGPEAPFAVMFLDFDRFKIINDSMGHRAGDELLVQLARRIQEKLRPHDIVARLGGDEFAILAERIDNERSAVVLAERLMEALRAPFTVQGMELVVSVSIGITFSTLGYDDAEAVLRDADTAMYKAKGGGRARYALFDASLHTAVSERLKLEGELRRAIDDGQLVLEYQPLFDLQDGGLAGFEALVRWQHPDGRLLPPMSFLRVAEETELMVRLTDFVLHCACRQVRLWQQLHASLAELEVSVNVSAADLAQPAFVARVGRAIVEADLRPQHLTLELTENILMSHLEDARETLAELRALGVRVAVDDFGTGYSSLAHLSRLPIDSLKIDRSFIDQLAEGRDDAAVVGAIVQLGRALHKGVVAEGIESADQQAQLRALGCRFGQGFHLGSPLNAQAAGDWLRARHDTLH